MNSDMNSWSWKFRYEFMITKNIVKSYQNLYIWIDPKFRLLNSYIWSHLWIHVMNSSMNSAWVIWRMQWIHGLIPKDQFTYEIMVEFIKLSLNGSGFSFKSVSVREQILIIQSNNDLLFAFISLPALRLLCCCSLMATGLCCCNCSHVVHNMTVVVLNRVGKTWRAWWTTLDITGVEMMTTRSAWPACQQWRKLLKPSSWEGSTSRKLSRQSN